MLFHKLCQAALLSAAAIQASALTIGGRPLSIKPYKREPLQDLVTWDEHSLFVRGERILFYSGEFHPFRLPVPSLWLDVFQKIKSLGYNGVSVYWDWALLEGKQGDFSAEGIFALEPFFEAAKTAGIYLLARPGPYINAEVSGGGFPGWLQRNPALPRTRDPEWLAATENYSQNMAKIIAKAQITEGGPVILFQPENEYSQANEEGAPKFPDPVYWKAVEDQFRENGIVVPMISNDARPAGYFAPGPPPASNVTVDIYGHDGYPLGFDCANPYTWPAGALPTNYGELHLNQSKSTPYSIVEFQGGSFDPWGGLGFAQCGDLIGPEFQRVFYKNDFSFGVRIFNIYMTYGGTNWGNLGHPGGYTSYDYGAVIAEGREVNREKYSQAKLLANFLQASPAYLTAVYQNNSNANGSYTDNPAIATTALFGEVTKFFVVRQGAYQSRDTVTYNITLPTSKGDISIPRHGGSLSLHGRDSKVFVTDYDVGGATLLYSTAEIFTWKIYGPKKVLVLYSGPDETNELAFSKCGDAKLVEGDGVQFYTEDSVTTIHYNSSPTRRIIELSENVIVYLLDRQEAYNYWVIDLPNDSTTGNYTNNKLSPSTPIIKAGYLLRTVEIEGQSIHLTGDLNATAPIEIIGGAPTCVEELTFNGESLEFTQADSGVVSSSVKYVEPTVSLPDLTSLEWKMIDSLPEVQPGYDDSLWTTADLTYSNNTARNLTTPTSLYSSDYGYHTGNLIYRGHFTATGNESTFYLATQGGSAYGHSVWLDSTFIGSLYGADVIIFSNDTYTLPTTVAGKEHVITVLIDNQGLDENGEAGDSMMKNPRGITDFNLSGHNNTDVKWKLTGNLHGEDYKDRTRGPLNEGGLYVERKGYHLPGTPTSSWKDSKGPSEGISSPGVAFYSTTFDLDLPVGYDIPLAFSFTNGSSTTSTSNNNTTTTTTTTMTMQKGTTIPSYRSQIYINGYQFGKYISNIGPQTVFPVPEGIFNYHGANYIGISLWALDIEGAKVNNFTLIANGPAIRSGYGPIELSPAPEWKERDGAY